MIEQFYPLCLSLCPFIHTIPGIGRKNVDNVAELIVLDQTRKQVTPARKNARTQQADMLKPIHQMILNGICIVTGSIQVFLGSPQTLQARNQ